MLSVVDLYLMASLLDDYSSKRCKVGSQQPAGATDHYSTHAEASLQKATSDLARLQAFRTAGSGEEVMASSASLQRARTLLQQSPPKLEPAQEELPTGAHWPLMALVTPEQGTVLHFVSQDACLPAPSLGVQREAGHKHARSEEE